MTKRHPAAVIALAFVTFGLYAYYWLYQTTKELREETDREDLSPTVDVLLALLTFGLWGVWAGYRNAQIVHEELVERAVEHTDKSIAVVAFAGLSLVSGWAWLVSMALVQQDLNHLADEIADEDLDTFDFGDSRRDEWAPKRAPSVRARVEVSPPADHRASEPAWNEAPSAPVFTSNAPAPIVF